MERELIKSELHDVGKVRKTIIIVGVVVSVLFYALMFFLDVKSNLWTTDTLGEAFNRTITAGGDIVNFLFIAIAILVVFIIIAFVAYKAMSNVSLITTDKRVYGTALFGKRVDLPLDSISAIGLGGIKGIAITTASGAIKFYMIKNRHEIYDVVSNLLVERQNKKESQNVSNSMSQNNSNADELKKYKDLLDSGIISQEEFDAKKKQLLGL